MLIYWRQPNRKAVESKRRGKSFEAMSSKKSSGWDDWDDRSDKIKREEPKRGCCTVGVIPPVRYEKVVLRPRAVVSEELIREIRDGGQVGIDDGNGIAGNNAGTGQDKDAVAAQGDGEVAHSGPLSSRRLQSSEAAEGRSKDNSKWSDGKEQN